MTQHHLFLLSKLHFFSQIQLILCLYKYTLPLLFHNFILLLILHILNFLLGFLKLMVLKISFGYKNFIQIQCLKFVHILFYKKPIPFNKFFLNLNVFHTNFKNNLKELYILMNDFLQQLLPNKNLKMNKHILHQQSLQNLISIHLNNVIY